MLYSIFLPIYFFAVNLKIFYKMLEIFYRKKQDRITKSFGDSGILSPVIIDIL